MRITLLGAHNRESRATANSCLLIDGVVAVDAGAITARLPLDEQLRLAAVLVTHWHYDHIRDLPGLAMNFYATGHKLDIYATEEVREDLTGYLFDGRHYPDFLERPPEDPTVRFITVAPYRPLNAAGYSILPVPAHHAVPAVGYQITSAEGKAVLCTGDTGPGLSECWQHVSPRLLIVEVTLPNPWSEIARIAGHFTPSLLRDEMLAFRETRGYLPQIITTHMDLGLEEEIEAQLDDVAEELDCPITPAYEGMQLQL